MVMKKNGLRRLHVTSLVSIQVQERKKEEFVATSLYVTIQLTLSIAIVFSHSLVLPMKCLDIYIKECRSVLFILFVSFPFDAFVTLYRLDFDDAKDIVVNCVIFM